MAAQDQNSKPPDLNPPPAGSTADLQAKTNLTVEELYEPSPDGEKSLVPETPNELSSVSQPVLTMPKTSTEDQKAVSEDNKSVPSETLPQSVDENEALAKEIPPKTEEKPVVVVAEIETPNISPAAETVMPVAPIQPTAPTSPPPPPVNLAEAKEKFSLSPKSKSKAGKIFKFLLGIIFLAVLLGGVYFLYNFIKEQKPGITGEKNLVYWGLWEDESILADLITDWKKDHPNINVTYKLQTKEEYRERLQSALARGEGPDIFRFHNSWLPMFKGELSILPASVMSASQFEETFYPIATKDLKIDANIYGLPLEIDTLALFYNENIFRAAGKEPPTDWDQLRELASELTVRSGNGQIQIAGVAMGGVGNIDHWSDILGLMMLQNGVDLTKPKGKLAEDALTFYTYLLRRDQAWDINFPNSTLAFANGKLAMYFGFSWDVFEILRSNKNLKFKIVPVPQLKERKPVAWASYWVEGVSKRSKNQSEAWEFLKYLTSKETLRKLYLAESKTRLFGEPYSRVDLAAEIKDDPLVGPFISQAAIAQSWYLCSRTFDNGLNSVLIKYFEDAINSINQGKEVADVLGTVAKGVNQAVSRYQISQ